MALIHSDFRAIHQALLAASKVLNDSSDSAKLDAQVLLAHVLEQSTTYLLTWPERLLSDQQLETYNQLLARRVNGEPVAYLVGSKEFWSLPLLVNESTLIPRPDTETLVELVLANHQQEHLALLDLGTGTGAIALALASEKPQWQITAVDFNAQAVKLAQTNAKRLNLTDVVVVQSNWFSALDSAVKFDVIVSNPPYIESQDPHLTQGDVRYEPTSALVADLDGLADIIHITKHAKQYLTTHGSLYFEHGFEQGEAVRTILNEHGFVDASTEQDLAGNDRITWAKLA